MNQDYLIHIIDDDAAVRRAISRLLEAAKYRVKCFATAEDYLAQISENQPDCLILDLHLPGLNGLELQNQLTRTERHIPVVFITARVDVPTCVTAMKAGAIDFLLKPIDTPRLLQSVQQAVVRGARARRDSEIRRSIELRRDRLTSRENQVFGMVVVGRLNKQIAQKLGISEKTVKVHRARVMEKMRAKSLADLVHIDEKMHAISSK